MTLLVYNLLTNSQTLCKEQPNFNQRCWRNSTDELMIQPKGGYRNTIEQVKKCIEKLGIPTDMVKIGATRIWCVSAEQLSQQSNNPETIAIPKSLPKKEKNQVADPVIIT